MKETPIQSAIVEQKINESNIPVLGKASIRELKRLVDNIEKEICPDGNGRTGVAGRADRRGC
jgi:hypothetical protein